MERNKLFPAALLLAAISAGNDVWALSDSRKKDTRPVESPQFFSGNANPLLDFIFVADPTSVEYNGRLYVYGTNDTQQILGITMYNIRCIMFLIMCLYVSSYHCNQMVLF